MINEVIAYIILWIYISGYNSSEEQDFIIKSYVRKALEI